MTAATRRPTRSDKVTGAVAGQPARFLPVHREFTETSVATHVTLSVPVSYEDLAAVLYAWKGYPLASLLTELDEMIAQGLLCRYREFLAARREISDLVPGTRDWERYITIHAAVLNRYASAPADHDASRAARRLEVA